MNLSRTELSTTLPSTICAPQEINMEPFKKQLHRKKNKVSIYNKNIKKFTGESLFSSALQQHPIFDTSHDPASTSNRKSSYLDPILYRFFRDPVSVLLMLF